MWSDFLFLATASVATGSAGAIGLGLVGCWHLMRSPRSRRKERPLCKA